MCGRYYVDDETAREIEKIVRQVDERIRSSKKTSDIFPSQGACAIRSGNSQMIADEMFWGFPNFSKKGLLINARSETVMEKRMFRDSVMQRRCVIPAKGFYEWNQSKSKAAFFRQDEPLLFMAGFFNRFEDQERFMILTTKANRSVEKVHDRMPLILERRELENWIFDEDMAKLLLRKTPVLLEKKMDYEQQTLTFL